MKGIEYHKLTSYSRGRLGRATGIYGGSPTFFKVYKGVPFFELPRNVRWPEVSFRDVVFGGMKKELSCISMDDISVLLYLSYGISATDRRGLFSFRTVPSAGALYPCEVYMCVGGRDFLPSGVYHYNVRVHGLEQIAIIEGSVDFFELWVSALPYRSAWKYGDRAMRYVLLDSGHLLEQIRLSASILNLNASVMYGFRNLDLSSGMVCIDENHEALIGRIVIKPLPDKLEISLTDSPNRLKSYSAPATSACYGDVIRSFLDDCKDGEFRANRGGETGAGGEDIIGGTDAVKVIINRRSRRNFIREIVSKDEFDIFHKAFGVSGLDENLNVYFVVERVEGLSPGVYQLRVGENVSDIVQIREGHLLSVLAQACLDQMWLANASFAVVFAVNEEKLREDDNNMGYRSAMLSAGRLGQITYLVSEALGWGCCGIGALYDDEVGRVVGGAGCPAYVLGAGPVKKRS